MKRALALSLAVAAWAAPAAHGAAPRLSEAAGARFPARTFALTLPRTAELDASRVQVTENGRSVEGLTIGRTTGRDAGRFGVVLAVDTSSSMRGRPLRAAVDAARTFVSHRPPSQPVALITFAGEVRVVQGFSTDPAVIDRALASVALSGGGSRLIDAAGSAVELIRRAQMPAGSAVLLSDGADRRSRTSLDRVAAAATAANARLYTVGLRSGSADFGSLNLLAAGSRAEFSEAASLQDLARVYERLGSQLAHQYLIGYRSTARPGRHVDVEVRIAGEPGAATFAYAAPVAPVRIRPPVRHSPAEQLWRSPALGALSVGLVAGLLVLAVWLLVRPRGASLRERVAFYVGEEPAGEEGARRAALLTGRLREGAGRSLERARWWPSFVEKLDVGRIGLAPKALVAWIAAGTLATMALITVVTGSPALGALALAVPFIARSVVERRVAGERKRFVEQLPDNLQVMASAMRAGHSFSGALSVVVADAPEPTRREMARVVADERLGVPIDAALGSVVRRMGSKDLEQVALVATLQRETGGNTAEVLERVTETIRDRLALRRMVQTLTAQGRMSRWVLTALPIVLLIGITVINPAYVAPLYETPTGRLLLGAAAFLVFTGSMAIKRIVDIEV